MRTILLLHVQVLYSSRVLIYLLCKSSCTAAVVIDRMIGFYDMTKLFDRLENSKQASVLCGLFLWPRETIRRHVKTTFCVRDVALVMAGVRVHLSIYGKG